MTLKENGRNCPMMPMVSSCSSIGTFLLLCPRKKYIKLSSTEAKLELWMNFFYQKFLESADQDVNRRCLMNDCRSTNLIDMNQNCIEIQPTLQLASIAINFLSHFHRFSQSRNLCNFYIFFFCFDHMLFIEPLVGDLNAFPHKSSYE